MSDGGLEGVINADTHQLLTDEAEVSMTDDEDDAWPEHGPMRHEWLLETVADLPEALAVALVGDLKEALALPGPGRRKLLH